MAALGWLLNLGFAGGEEESVTTVAGPEYTVPEGKLHATAPDAKLHYVVPNKEDD